MITSFDDTDLYYICSKNIKMKYIEHNNTVFWKNQEVFQKNMYVYTESLSGCVTIL